jgi:hypothetical protein
MRRLSVKAHADPGTAVRWRWPREGNRLSASSVTEVGRPASSPKYDAERSSAAFYEFNPIFVAGSN